MFMFFFLYFLFILRVLDARRHLKSLLEPVGSILAKYQLIPTHLHPVHPHKHYIRWRGCLRRFNFFSKNTLY